MSDDHNQGDDAVVDDASNNNITAINGAGMRAGAHDQNTIFQQNNAALNEIMQSLIENRRQEVAQFEMRMVQSNNLFANQMMQVLSNQDAQAARSAGLQTQQQSYTHGEATQNRAQTTAELYASMGIITILP